MAVASGSITASVGRSRREAIPVLACSASTSHTAMPVSSLPVPQVVGQARCGGSTARLTVVSCQSIQNITPSIAKTTRNSLRMMSALSTSISRSMFVSPVARSTRSPVLCAVWTERERRWRCAKNRRRTV